MNKDGQFAKFYDIFLKEIYPEYGEVEKCRKCLLTEHKKAKLPFVIVSVIALIFGVASLYHTMQTTQVQLHDIRDLILILIFSSLFYFLIPNIIKIGYNKKYNEYLKKHYSEKLLKLFCNIEKRNFLSIFAKNEIDKLDLCQEYLCDDAFCGKYKDVTFKIAEIAGAIVYSQDSKQKEYSAGKGSVIMIFDFNKKIASEVKIISRKEILQNRILLFAFILLFSVVFGIVILILFPFVILPLIVFYIIHKLSQKKMDEVKLEDTEFDKRFRVSSADQVEARYLCTPAFMERLHNLSTAFGADKLKCCFCNIEDEPKIIITIHTKKDIFELGDINKPINEDTTIYGFYREINSIYKIIDALKLDNKTGM